MNLPAIEMRGVSKRYTKYDDQPMLATQLMRLRSRSKRSKLWALRDVDLVAERGECVGVIGRNGAGKTTMLQLLAGVTAPTSGSVAVRGRIAPLIAVGVGFHPELSGRENVYVNGSILGLNRAEIDRRFDSIVDFSEVEKFIDTPVKFYSSGMSVRLGFAVAIQAEPDVLLVDEVLAVGDLAFQWKCFDRMMEIRRSGTTIAVVSHNLNAVRKLCDRTLLVNEGRVIFEGETIEAISRFHQLMDEHREMDEDATTSSVGVIESVEVFDEGGHPTGHLESGDTMVVRASVRFYEEVVDPRFSLSVRTATGVGLYSDVSGDGVVSGSFGAGETGVCEIRMEARLGTGSYQALVSMVSNDRTEVLDGPRLTTFYVSGRPGLHGADLGADFSLERHVERRDLTGSS